ncbi:hypothetical protein IC614_08025 [Allosphingosinicella flava]|uniref:Uncharacterized protein n=1 Tax=Allosphingosinicella flava TaxID=2771430 RepID=A0A7T2GI58_9SPHN|nr:hypothetical protein [Sphingosinicella flava]QPQ54305.1 hypothetical protein IC614_08025 [Sphingosinicella flava]
MRNAFFSPAVAAALLLSAPSAAQDTSRLDSQAKAYGDLADRVVDHWAGREPEGEPSIDLPELRVSEQYANSVSEAERALMQRRLEAITAFLLAQPSLQNSDIQVTPRWMSLYRLNMNDGAYLTMGVTYEFQLAGDIATVSVTTSPVKGMPGEWRTVGRTAGGCRREQKAKGSGTGGEVYRIGTVGGAKGTAIKAVEIEGGGGLNINPRLDVDSQAESIVGRVVAAVQTLDCNKLLALANGQ